MTDTSDTGPIELNSYRVSEAVWFLDRHGKSRRGVIRRLGITPKGVPYAEIFDEIDKRSANLVLETLSKSPIEDVPKARARRSIQKKGRGRS